MKTDFTTTIAVNKSAKEVYEAINNVSGWWQGEIKGVAIKPGNEFDYRMKDIHFSKQKVTELVPNRRIVWQVTDSNLSSFDKPTEWTGTKIIFDIEETGNQTQVRFTHQGLVPAFQCYEDCSWGWSALIGESLLSLITTGKGKKVF
jgi:hypothetical protein